MIAHKRPPATFRQPHSKMAPKRPKPTSSQPMRPLRRSMSQEAAAALVELFGSPHTPSHPPLQVSSGEQAPSELALRSPSPAGAIIGGFIAAVKKAEAYGSGNKPGVGEAAATTKASKRVTFGSSNESNGAGASSSKSRRKAAKDADVHGGGRNKPGEEELAGPDELSAPGTIDDSNEPIEAEISSPKPHRKAAGKGKKISTAHQSSRRKEAAKKSKVANSDYDDDGDDKPKCSKKRKGARMVGAWTELQKEWVRDYAWLGRFGRRERWIHMQRDYRIRFRRERTARSLQNMYIKLGTGYEVDSTDESDD